MFFLLVSAVQDSTGVDVIRRRFTARASSVAKARQFAVTGITDPELRSRVATVVSELATNAIRHARTAFNLEVRTDSSGIRVTVADSDPSPPKIMDGVSPHEPAGRGLMIVAALADRWGYEPDGHGKSVWAELDA